MFLNKICLATVLLSIHAASAYVLLTANLDDVHALAKQIASSPLAQQLNEFIRRASSTFNKHYNKENEGENEFQMRSDDKLDDKPDFAEKQTDNKYSDVVSQKRNKHGVPLLSDDDTSEVWQPDNKVIQQELDGKMPDTSSEEQDSNRVERRQLGQDLIALGKNASFYLKSIKKIFENV